jgi:seryl-tRNA synthetase
MNTIDDRLAAMAEAVELEFPPLIPRATLERAGYFEAFPDGAIPADGAQCFMPAVCYHCYARWAGERLAAPRLVTCVGRCRRNEYAPPERLREFTMREFVFAGPPDWVVEQRRTWMTRVEALARSLGLRPTLDLASDPFFGGDARGKQLIQQLKELKFELRVGSMALASFNLHETHFTRRFDIALAGGQVAHTGCVAFGLERWALALEASHDLR